MNIPDFLKSTDALKEVPLRQLEWLVERSTTKSFQQGDPLFLKGSPMDHLLVALKGRFVIRLEQNNQYKIINYIETGDVGGVLPFSRATHATAEGIALEDAEVLFFHKDHFKEMIHTQDELTASLVQTMSTRIRDFTKQRQQDDKMLSLGKLSAGLAHELNNPSAAVVRSAQELIKHLRFLPEGFKQVIKIRASDEEVDIVNDLLFSKIKEDKPQLSMLEKSSLEDDLLDWFEDEEIDNAEEIAEVFVEFNFSEDDLDIVKDNLRVQDLAPVVNWMSQVLTTEKLVNEIENASQRINDLVCSVKSYTHMDQAPEKQKTNIHAGIRNTLTMLNHKLKKAQVQVEEDFQDDLPEPAIFVSEMNQVWTNLIDNAIDAMSGEEKKTLTIKTEQLGDFIHVYISDTGSGIPEDVQSKIFDPFYTTKGVGQGTGLGLDVVSQIIAQHKGKISVESVPGNTVFNVCIPIDLKK